MWKWIVFVLVIVVVAGLVYASATTPELVDTATVRRGTGGSVNEERGGTRRVAIPGVRSAMQGLSPRWWWWASPIGTRAQSARRTRLRGFTA